MKTWIWADTHLGHLNIIKYCNRPFKDIYEMNDTMLKNWKKIVKPVDTIIHLGDVSSGIDKDTLGGIIRSMPGKKLLIMGNHDFGHSIKWWEDVGFDRVYDYPIIYKKWFMLSHTPLFINQQVPYANIHGHIHQNKMEGKGYINVSVEQTNYMPICLEDIIAQCNINPNMYTNDKSDVDDNDSMVGDDK